MNNQNSLWSEQLEILSSISYNSDLNAKCESEQKIS